MVLNQNLLQTFLLVSHMEYIDLCGTVDFKSSFGSLKYLYSII